MKSNFISYVPIILFLTPMTMNIAASFSFSSATSIMISKPEIMVHSTTPSHNDSKNHSPTLDNTSEVEKSVGIVAIASATSHSKESNRRLWQDWTMRVAVAHSTFSFIRLFGSSLIRFSKRAMMTKGRSRTQLVLFMWLCSGAFLGSARAITPWMTAIRGRKRQRSHQTILDSSSPSSSTQRIWDFTSVATASRGGGSSSITRKRRRIFASSSSLEKEVDIANLHAGYTMLHDFLSATSKLWMLKGIKRFLFHLQSVDEIREIMDVAIAKGRKRQKELTELRNLEPDVSTRFVDPNPVASAMNDVIKDKIIAELMDRTERFDLNFALTQLQASRMIVATCRGLMPFEPNTERSAWLEEVALEYEAFRKHIVCVIDLYCKGEGSWQKRQAERSNG